MKRRLLAGLLALTVLLCGCGPVIENTGEALQIYASFFPIYALSGLVLEDVSGIGLKCIVQPQDDCLRLYDLSDWDASVLAYDADAVIIGGRGLESFESALYTFGSDGPAVITAMHDIGLYEQSASSGTDGITGHLYGYNPYLYMSVAGARSMTNNIADALAELFPDKEQEIISGAAKADEKLAAAEKSIAAICKDAAGTDVILMNEALIYTAHELGLRTVYRYDREPGTTLYGSSLDAALETFEKTGARMVLIEKHAPAELTKALADAGYSVVLIDTLTSYPTDATPDRYIEVQLENARAVAAGCRTEQ